MESLKTWFIYIIENDKGFYYTGITTDIERRFNEHKFNPKKGARFFRYSTPVKVVYSEKCDNRSEATKRENQIKRMSKPQKRKLVENQISN